MAKLMWICGILLIAAGVALGVVNFVSQAGVAHVSLEACAILLVGGVLAAGLGSVIDALRRLPLAQEGAMIAASTAAQAAAATIPEFGPRAAKAAAAAAAAAAAVAPGATAEEVSEPTRDTIKALEQARQKIEQAFDPDKAPAEKTPDAQPEAVVEEEDAVLEEVTIEEEEVVDDGQLYVVEERLVRRRPARILSDGTVEAETAEGWMRFENLEHLNEYLDSIEPAKG